MADPTAFPPIVNGTFDLDYRVQDVLTASTVDVVGEDGFEPGADGPYPVFHEIGADWLAGDYRGLHENSIQYLNWRTGAQGNSYEPSGGSARQTVDLDRPALLRRLCSHVRRIPQPAPDPRAPDTNSPYFDLQSGGGWAVSYSTPPERITPAVVAIQRCGRGTVGHRTFPGNFAPVFQLGGGLLSYERPGVGVVEDLTTRHLTRWRLPEIGGLLNHTLRDLFVSVPLPGGGWRIYRASIPQPRHGPK